MKKRYLFGSLVVLLAGVGVVACADPLDVPNQNDPDRTRTFSNPQDLQVFVSGLYAVALQANITGSNDGLLTQMYVMSMENTSGLANFAMGPRGAIPRAPITNQRGSQGNAGNYYDFFRGHRAAREAALAIAALKKLNLGSATAQDRANAFARFAQGVALGNLSLAYDSAAILTEFDNPEADASVVVALSGARAVNAAALRYLDSAIAIAQADKDAFPLPVQANFWFNGLATTQAEFIQLARSYKAIFRASIARTPAERADSSRSGGIVAWDSVIADANAGITADFATLMDAANGWDVQWYQQIYAGAQWHQMSQFWLGMADTSSPSNYLDYLNKANSVRVPILIVSPDKRIPSGTSRTTQNAATTTAGQPFANTPYFRNRPSGSDVSGEPLQVSMYDFWRGRQFQQAARVGRYPVMTAAQIRLLAAEGYIRTGNFAEAIRRINVSRNGIGGLAPIDSTITDTIAVVSGGNSCVPKVPVMTSPRTLKCGNVWDALKYEYRMETAYTGYGSWFFAMRGWGDLPQYTTTQWPVPYNEMDARGEGFYGFGGPGGQSAAGPGNYGLFSGGVY